MLQQTVRRITEDTFREVSKLYSFVIYCPDYEGEQFYCSDEIWKVTGYNSDSFKSCQELFDQIFVEKLYTDITSIIENPNITNQRALLAELKTEKQNSFPLSADILTDQEKSKSVLCVLRPLRQLSIVRKTEFLMTLMLEFVWEWDISSGNLFWHGTPESKIKDCFGSMPLTWDDFTQLVHPEDRVKVSRVFNREYKKLAVIEVEYRALTPSGEYQWRKDFAYPIHNEEEKITGYFGGCRNISKRVENELNLKKNTERFRIIAEATSEFFWEWNTQTDELIWIGDVENELSKVLFSVPNTINEWLDIIHPDDQGVVIAEAETHRHNPKEMQFTYRIKSADGSYVWWEDVGRPVYDEDGNLTRYIGGCSDVTQRVELQQKKIEEDKRYQHAQKLQSLGILSGGFAHDFNNLLATISLNTEFIAEEVEGSDMVRESLDSIRTATKQAADLCVQLLSYAGRSALDKNVVKINSLIRKMEALIQSSISKSVRVEYDLNKEDMTIKAVASQINQIILNLIINSSEAIHSKDGIIRVSTLQSNFSKKDVEAYLDHEQMDEGDYLIIRIEDNGSGMNRQTMERLFEPFYTTKFTGRGLGLSAVLGIVQNHHGGVHIESEVGKGTIFEIALPTFADAPVQKRLTPLSTSKLKHAPFVLVIDDDEMLRRSTVKCLKKFDSQVIESDNGRDGVAMYEEHKDNVDLVVLDLAMPHMDGMEAFRVLRQKKKGLSIIIISGNISPDFLEEVNLDPNCRVLSKPFSVREMIDTVNKILSRK